jgi:hypothetical protein
MAEAACPVFVWPMARSGGTLLATLLGAHSRIAMSYEIYEDDLFSASGSALAPLEALAALRAARGRVNAIAQPRLRAFVARAHRGGVGPELLEEELRAYAAEGGSFATLDARLDFIERLMRLKMRRDGKSIWGGKAKAELDVLARRHPGGALFMMLRDGRDVLASRMHTGSFDKDPAAVANEWRSRLQAFSRFAELHPARARFVVYERLIREPRAVLDEMFTSIGLAFEPAVLDYQSADLTLVRHSYGHLSAQRIAEGLNDRTIGRWRSELSAQQAQAFESVAADELRRWGYA